MSETLTVRENILATLETILGAITTTAGYNNTIVKAQRWSKNGNPLSSLPTIIVHAGPEDKEPKPNPMVTCMFNIYLDVWTNHPESDTRSSDKILNSLLGDIEKALVAAEDLSGYADNVNITRVEPFESVEGQPLIGLTIEVTIEYQHRQTDPTSRT